MGEPFRSPYASASIVKAIIPTCLWLIWKDRTNRIFNGANHTPNINVHKTFTYTRMKLHIPQL